MRKAFFYIGSNNKTGELEIDNIEAIIGKYFDEFTAYEVIGYWRKSRERTLKVEVITDEVPTVIARVAKELKTTLNQDAVGLEIVETNFALV